VPKTVQATSPINHHKGDMIFLRILNEEMVMVNSQPIADSDVLGLASEGSGLAKTQARPNQRALAWPGLGFGLGQGLSVKNERDEK
jgi:hypothetical protein